MILQRIVYIQVCACHVFSAQKNTYALCITIQRICHNIYIDVSVLILFKCIFT